MSFTPEDPIEEWPDATLVEAVLRGEARAEWLLFRRHVGAVHRIASQMSGDTELADDLTQQVFIRVFDRLNTFRGHAAFSTWLHRVAVTTCLNALRRVRRTRAIEVPLDLATGASGQDGDPIGGMAVRTALQSLPADLRLPLVLYAIEGHSHGEVAAILEIPEGTSRRRVHEARQRLRQELGLTEMDRHR